MAQEITTVHKIYAITCLVNGKMYVGQTKSELSTRWKEHVRLAKSSSTYFSRAIRKHGSDAFCIFQVEGDLSKELANEREAFYISVLKTHGLDGYNSTVGGEGGRITNKESLKRIGEATSKRNLERKKKLGYVVSPETREKIRLSNLGRKKPQHNRVLRPKIERLKPEQLKQLFRYKFGGAGNPMFGKSGPLSPCFGRKHSPETKLKIKLGILSAKRPDLNTEKIISLYNAGWGTPRIARELNTFAATIRGRLKTNGIVLRKWGRKCKAA